VRASPPPLEGRRIGAYRILGEIGRGGMGVVYRAVRADDAFQKTVALKVVRGQGGWSDVEHRLERERHILARLQHPNIAAVFDGGTTEEGQPYLVMELVEGRPITEYCAANALGTRARLEMVRAVCDAVQYAHRNLVVHRDLKPGNILVGDDGRPKLLDFGIAKLLAAGVDPDVAPTATMLPMMTPEYASPEQVRGETVTTSSDIYSLGVVLYELLTGQRPYAVQTDSLEGIVRAVCDSAPPLPSTVVGRGDAPTRPALRGELRGDLDTIVLKALRKEPSRRYLTAQDLSEDIRRHLEGRPVLARADTLGYRVLKFTRRHKGAVAAAALVMMSLVGGIVATARQARIAEANRLRAERRFEDVRKLANSFLFEFHDATRTFPGPRPPARWWSAGPEYRTAWPRRRTGARRCSSSWRRPTRRWATSRERSAPRTSGRPRRPTGATPRPSRCGRPSRPRDRCPSRRSATWPWRARGSRAYAWPRETGPAPRGCSSRCAPSRFPWPRSGPTTLRRRWMPPAAR
jgi:non-specific serine/threonine protein kinase/serine/threonine-protein kinase